jgi:phage recombination protein Bet
MTQPGNEIVLHEQQQPGRLVQLPSSSGLTFTAEQEQLIRDSFANGASNQEFQVLMAVAKARRLNPLLKQIHFVDRWDRQKNRKVWSTQVSIDGLRAIAERTGRYDGQDEPVYEYDSKGGLERAKVRVYRRDWNRPAVGVALFAEYAQTTKEGGLTSFWREKPHVMLAKCAEALAIRKAFPEDTAGLYVPEEMQDSPAVERRAPLSPHIDAGESADAAPREGTNFDTHEAHLLDIERRIDVAETFADTIPLRRELGSKAKPDSVILRNMQAERDRMTPKQRKTLGQIWQRCNRKLDALEAAKRPSVEDSFRDEPDEPDHPDVRHEASAPEDFEQ